MLGMGFKPAPLGDKQWKELQPLQPDKVCQRAAVRFEKESGYYLVSFMGAEYRVYPQAEQLEGAAGDPLIEDIEFKLLVLTYLLLAQEVPLVEKWVSEKDLKGGSLFFKGPHALPVKPLIERFGKNPELLLKVGTAIGGQPMAEYGDAALRFQAFPRIPVACVLWAEDDEFPARVSFLFDPSIESHLPLDVVLAFVRCVVTKIIRAA